MFKHPRRTRRLIQINQRAIEFRAEKHDFSKHYGKRAAPPRDAIFSMDET
jgi:hypothetical protein